MKSVLSNLIENISSIFLDLPLLRALAQAIGGRSKERHNLRIYLSANYLPPVLNLHCKCTKNNSHVYILRAISLIFLFKFTRLCKTRWKSFMNIHRTMSSSFLIIFNLIPHLLNGLQKAIKSKKSGNMSGSLGAAVCVKIC